MQIAERIGEVMVAMIVDIYGKVGANFKAVFSSNPNMILKFCTACPEAPLHKLSITETIIA
jgi:hypothetical protein